MAIIMNINVDKFLDKVLEQYSSARVYAKVLMAVPESSFVLELYTLKITVFGKKYQLPIKVSTNSLMLYKPEFDNVVAQQAIKDIAAWITTVYNITKAANLMEIENITDKLYGVGADKTGPVVAKEQEFVHEPDPPIAVAPKPKAIFEVVKLKDSETVGQRVYGTSSGSFYTTIAVSPRVKVAAKRSKDNLSLRVEWVAPTPQEVQGINESGANVSPTYASLHLAVPNAVIERRAVGAFLFGMGIKFDQQLDSLEVVK